MTVSRQITIARRYKGERIEIPVTVYADDLWTGVNNGFPYDLTISEHDRAMALFDVFTEHGVYRPSLQ